MGEKNEEGEAEEEVLGIDDVDVLNSPKLLMGDSAVTELAIMFTVNDRLPIEDVVEACTHPEQLEEDINKLLEVKFLGYDEEEEELYHRDTPVGECLRGLCRATFTKQKKLQDDIGKAEGGQIDSMLFREKDGERTIRFGGNNIAEE